MERASPFAEMKSPDLPDIEALADAAYAGLPQHVHALCERLVIRVAEFPDEETLNEMECETEFDLLGLFQGRGLPQSGATPDTGEFPNTIWLYRRPILDFWAEHDETLGAIVSHVLIHEIGHHFGFSDEDMEALEQSAD